MHTTMIPHTTSLKFEVWGKGLHLHVKNSTCGLVTNNNVIPTLAYCTLYKHGYNNMFLLLTLLTWFTFAPDKRNSLTSSTLDVLYVCWIKKVNAVSPRCKDIELVSTEYKGHSTQKNDDPLRFGRHLV